MSGRCVLVPGAAICAVKSSLATAPCRRDAHQGLKVAAFGAQNISNCARVVERGEVGSSHCFQALAARGVPHLRMNPVMLKPERDNHSQLVLMGRVVAPPTLDSVFDGLADFAEMHFLPGVLASLVA